MNDRDVRYAVAYVLAAKDGLVQDPHPIETITKEYGLSDRKSVQTWIANTNGYLENRP